MTPPQAAALASLIAHQAGWSATILMPVSYSHFVEAAHTSGAKEFFVVDGETPALVLEQLSAAIVRHQKAIGIPRLVIPNALTPDA